MPPTSSRRRPKPIEIDLEQERDNRESMGLFRPTDGSVTIDQNTRFAIVPGPKGKGWSLKVFQDPE